MMKRDCISCGKDNMSKDAIGINQKLLGEKIGSYYCIECLAEYLGVNEQDIMDKIEEFKEQGCMLFE